MVGLVAYRSKVLLIHAVVSRKVPFRGPKWICVPHTQGAMFGVGNRIKYEKVATYSLFFIAYSCAPMFRNRTAWSTGLSGRSIIILQGRLHWILSRPPSVAHFLGKYPFGVL